MDDALLVHVLQSIANLLDNCSCFFLRQFPLLLDLLQTAIWQSFDDEIQVLLIMEVPKQSSDIGLVQVGLDLNFPQNVVFHLHFPDPLLRHLLYHANKANVLLLGHIHIPKRTFA